MLSRADVLKLLDDLATRTKALKALLTDEKLNVPPVLVARSVVELARTTAKLEKLTHQARREAT